MSSSSSKQPDSLKFFSPQRGIFKSSLQSSYTPNRTTNYKSVLLPEQHSLDKSLDIEKKVDKVYEECKSEISILKQKFQKIEDSSKPNVTQSQKTQESPGTQEQPTANFRGLSPFRPESSSQDMNLVLKEWKIRKTNELIEKFEAQTQGLLRENEKLTKIGKQRQAEIDRLKAQSFSSSCKLKEYESKMELLREELEQAIAIQREKEEEIEGWKMRYFENEQKLAVFDSMEFKLMESEYLILDYQRRLEGGEELRERSEFSLAEGNKITSLIDQIEEIHRKFVGRKAEDRETHKSDRNGLNLSFQTPEKNRENCFDLALVQLRNIAQFMREDMESFTREETQEGTIRKLERELEMERREKVALNSRIMIMKSREKEDKETGSIQETERLRGELGNKAREIEEKEKKLREWEEKYSHSESVRSDLERKLGLETKNKQESNDLRKIIASNEERLREIEGKNEEMRENINNNECLMRESNEFKEKMKLEIEKYNKELTEKRKRINELERGFFQSQQLEMALQKAKLEIESLNEEIRENSNEKLELLRKMEELESLRSQNKELKALESEKERLVVKLKEKDEIIRKMLINNEEISGFIEKNKDLSLKLLEMEREIKGIQVQNMDLQEQNKELQKLNKELQEESENTHRKIKEREETPLFSEDLNRKESAFIKLQEGLTTHQIRENELQNKITSLENTLDRKLRETSDMRTSLEAQLRQQATLIDQLKGENKSIISTSQRKERDLQLKIESLERDLRETLEIRSQLEQRLHQQTDLSIEPHEGNLEAMERDLKEAKDLKTRLEAQCREQLLLIEQLKGENHSITQTQLRNQRELQSRIQSLERELTETMEIRLGLENQLREQGEVIEKIRGEGALGYGNEGLGLREENMSLKMRNESLGHDLAMLQKEVMALKGEMRHKEDEISGSGQEILALRRENEEMRRRYEEKMKGIEEKMRENEKKAENKGGLEEINEKIEIRSKELDKIVEGLREELENERKKAKGFKDSLEKTRSETKMLFLLGVAVIICISLFFFMS